MINLPKAAERPTMYFIGVTTKQSSIMNLFPVWAKILMLGEVDLVGIDIEIHANEEDYRSVVSFIKNDPLSVGALITTHKIDLYNACHDQFDYLDDYAKKFGELSSISKKDGLLCGHAKDPISSGLALDAFVPENYWINSNSEVLILGAGGSALAICAYLADSSKGLNVPKHIHITNRSTARLAKAVEILGFISVPMSFHKSADSITNNRIMKQLPEGSLIINATGLGKDRPGSPLVDKVDFPNKSIIWELNYRGTLEFLHQALTQKVSKELIVEDGWTYFIHGWTQVISEVFHIEITNSLLKECDKAAQTYRGN